MCPASVQMIKAVSQIQPVMIFGLRQQFIVSVAVVALSLDHGIAEVAGYVHLDRLLVLAGLSLQPLVSGVQFWSNGRGTEDGLRGNRAVTFGGGEELSPEHIIFDLQVSHFLLVVIKFPRHIYLFYIVYCNPRDHIYVRLYPEIIDSK